MTGLAKILSIAGSDPSGGAGIQGDLKTFSALGCYGMAAITALTAQNTLGVQGVRVIEADFVAAQIDSVCSDIKVDAAKIGMIGSVENVEAIGQALRRWDLRQVVLDPVMIATGGHSLGGDRLLDPIRLHLFPLARLITPNLIEAALFAGDRMPENVGDMRALALKLHRLGAPAVLIKGGHFVGGPAVDLLYDGEQFVEFSAPRIATPNTHGTGCALAAGIAARLGQNFGLAEAVDDAKRFLSAALELGATLDIGAGHGPPHHFGALWAKAAESK